MGALCRAAWFWPSQIATTSERLVNHRFRAEDGTPCKSPCPFGTSDYGQSRGMVCTRSAIRFSINVDANTSGGGRPHSLPVRAEGTIRCRANPRTRSQSDCVSKG
jgi:hypothetical protein